MGLCGRRGHSCAREGSWGAATHLALGPPWPGQELGGNAPVAGELLLSSVANYVVRSGEE